MKEKENQRGNHTFLEILPEELEKSLERLPASVVQNMEEIRLSVGCPGTVYSKGKEYSLEGLNENHPSGIGSDTLRQYFSVLAGHSVYSYQEDISRGFLTVKGGHRVGLCGAAVVDNGKVKTIKDFSSLTIRRGREVKGVSNGIMKYLVEKGLYNTLIVSPPKCGKTTLLRDIVRNVSNMGFRTGVCDERSEIAGCYRGVPTYDLGMRTDVLDGCPKAEGLLMLVRSMSPDVVVADEIGKAEDIDALEKAIVSGVGILTTIHGSSFEDVAAGHTGTMIQRGFFKRIITLSRQPRTGTVVSIVNEKNVPLYMGDNFL